MGIVYLHICRKKGLYRIEKGFFHSPVLLSEDFGRTEPDLPIWKDLTVALLLNTRSFSCIDPAGIHHAASATTRTDSAIELSIDELEKYSGSVSWIDVCKNWQA